MKYQDLKKNSFPTTNKASKFLNKFPDLPGVYLFKRGKAVLYIGKATSLQDRVKSYFNKNINISRSLLIENMVKEATSIKCIKTDSVLEALILEANLIKQYKPKYNTKEKDDRSFNFVVITKEYYPRVFIMRGKDLEHNLKLGTYNLKYIYGPYTSGGSLKEALKIVRKIFPFRGEKDTLKRVKRKSYLNEEIGITPKFSVGVDKKEYAKIINHIRLFFEGKSSQVLKNLRIDMREAVGKKEFEKAEEIKRQIFALNHINDVALIKEQKIFGDKEYKIEAYDIAHTSLKERVGVMVVIKDGELQKSDYRKFKIRTEKEGDTDALAEILERRLGHPEWSLPKLIVVDGGLAQKNTAERVLNKFGYQIPVVAVVKGLGHKPKGIQGARTVVLKRESEILLANNEAHRFAIKYHREKRKLW